MTYPTKLALVSNFDAIEIHIQQFSMNWKVKGEIESFFQQMDQLKYRQEQMMSSYFNEDYLKYEEELTKAVRNGSMDYLKECPKATKNDVQRLFYTDEAENTRRGYIESLETCEAKIKRDGSYLIEVQNKLWNDVCQIIERCFLIFSQIFIGLVDMMFFIESFLFILGKRDKLFSGKKLIVISYVITLLSMSIYWEYWTVAEKYKYEDWNSLLNYLVVEGQFYFYAWNIVILSFMTVIVLLSKNANYFNVSQAKSRFDKKQARRNKRKASSDPTKLHQYCSLGNREKVKDLIHISQHKIDINEVKSGQTPLHEAIAHNHVAIVRILIKSFDGKINTSIRNRENHNLLDLAVIKRNKDICDLVMGVKATPSISSLFWALKTDQEYLVEKMSSLKTLVMDKDIQVDLQEFLDLKNEFKVNKKLSKITKDIMSERLDILKVSLTNRLKIKCPQLGLNRSTEVLKRPLCIVCGIEMKEPLHILACSKDHYHCSKCSPKLKSCPFCREDFKVNTPTRRRHV